MENYIDGRAILGMLCFVHIFILYAIQCPWGPIKRKALNGIILTELVVVTAYIIYDNLQMPPHDWWFAIIGYLFVYGFICMTWIAYLVFTLLDEDKIYEMTITHHVHLMNEDYLEGFVYEGKYKYSVYLPYSSELEPLIENNTKLNVKFVNVFRASYIIVKHVEQNN